MHWSLEQAQSSLAYIVLLPLLGATINGLFGHRLPKPWVVLFACGSVFTSFLLALGVFSALLDGNESVVTRLFTWMDVGNIHLTARFNADHLSGLMTLVITGVGFLIHLYSTSYMSHDESFSRYFAYLNLFTFAMLVLVLGDSLPLMFVGWEGVGLCSYLLIGFWFTDDAKASAGKKAFVVNRIGDFGFIVAMMLLARFVGALDFNTLKDAALAGHISEALATGVCVMMLLGATGKSAQIPLYIWLPDAMAGPTPVSALIHAATMVTAGVYMSARLSFLFTLSPVAMFSMACIGAATALFAATIGVVQNDIKKVLAYSTVSQLGFMFIAAGVGAYAIALFHVVTHAFFKACLFLGSGSVIHGMSGEQDMRLMGGLRKKMPITFITFFIATLAITGFPFLSGFISKDAILFHAFMSGHGKFSDVFAHASTCLWLVGVCAAGFTSFYMWRLVFMTFFSGSLRASHEVAHHVHESPWPMTLPLIVLAFLSIVGGALGWPHIFGGHEFIASWLEPVVGHVPEYHGEHTALELTLMAISTGVALGGFGLAYALYAKQIHPKTEQLTKQGVCAWFYERLLNKWHVDALYDAIVVHPLRRVSEVFFFRMIDRTVIDGSVNGVGTVTRSIGFFGQLLHNGNVQRYLAIFALGCAFIMYMWLAPAGWMR